MASFLIYRAAPGDPFGNSNQVNGVIANGVDEASARAAAQAAAPGAAQVYAGWSALQLSAADAPQSPIWIQGIAVIPGLGGKFRGQ